MELGNETQIPMETKESAQAEVEGCEVSCGANGEDVKGEKGGESDGGREGEAEGDSEIEMDAALELVDQMEIEISDGEGDASPNDVMEGGGGGGKKETDSDSGVGKLKVAAAKVAPAKETEKERKQKPPSKRRHSSALSAVEFPTISTEKQLSDHQTVNLMNLLHVCCGLKVSYFEEGTFSQSPLPLYPLLLHPPPSPSFSLILLLPPQMQSQMYLTNDETSVILSLITCTCPPFSPAGVQFIQITLAMLLACPFLIG